MASLQFLQLPPEIRQTIYDLLVIPHKTIKEWEGDYSQPRKCLTSQQGRDVVRWENWWPGDALDAPHERRWFSSVISFKHISAMLRVCKQCNFELGEFVYQRLIWHARVGRYSVPALPLQVCPSYARSVRHYSLHLHHGNSLDGILEGTDHVYIKFSSFFRNLQTFCMLLASQGRLKSLQIDALLPSQQALVDVVDALSPLIGHVEELRVGKLEYEIYDRMNFASHQFLSNAGYQKLKQMFGDQVRWKFPLLDAQYKD